MTSAYTLATLIQADILLCKCQQLLRHTAGHTAHNLITSVALHAALHRYTLLAALRFFVCGSSYPQCLEVRPAGSISCGAGLALRVLMKQYSHLRFGQCGCH
jgi:hypothetical protein